MWGQGMASPSGQGAASVLQGRRRQRPGAGCPEELFRERGHLADAVRCLSRRLLSARARGEGLLIQPSWQHCEGAPGVRQLSSWQDALGWHPHLRASCLGTSRGDARGPAWRSRCPQCTSFLFSPSWIGLPAFRGTHPQSTLHCSRTRPPKSGSSFAGAARWRPPGRQGLR